MFVVFRIPGQLNDRRTPLGELNWIFTAVTDTIAWNTLPRGEVRLLTLNRLALLPGTLHQTLSADQITWRLKMM